MKKLNYLEVFDSKNTAVTRDLHHANTGDSIKFYGKKESLKEGIHHVIAYKNSQFVKYEKGVATEWSYPEGITN